MRSRYLTTLAVVISVIMGISFGGCKKEEPEMSNSSHGEEKDNKQYRGKQQEKRQEASKVLLSLNLKKGFSCHVVYNSEVNITQKGQSDGTGKWKVKANLLLECIDVNTNDIMTISQYPLKIWVEGTDIEGKHEIDFHSPDKKLQIPDLVRGHLSSLLAIKSARLDAEGKIIAARQSPDRNNFDFMAMGKISYQDDPEWILPDSIEDKETVKYIVNSMLGLLPNVMGKELSMGQTLTIKEQLPKVAKGEIAHNWTLKSIQNRIAQLELMSNVDSEHKVPNKFVDEVAHFQSSSKTWIVVNIDTGLALKYQGDVEAEHRTMTLTTLLSSRVPTFSNTSKTSYTIKIIE
ncbi:MAG: hypothetical protein ACYSU3_18920 [Planctomycetota bacterium]